MTDEQKDLLFKDLCARMPYNTKVQLTEYSDLTGEKLPSEIRILDHYMIGKVQAYCRGFRKDEVKPYLFPMSSMTDEQMEELEELCDLYSPDDDYRPYACLGIEVLYKHVLDDGYKFNFKRNVIDWFNKNHLDYRGLIPLGLAIDATGLGIYR